VRSVLKAENGATVPCRFVGLLEATTLDAFGESLASQVSSPEYDILHYIPSPRSALVVHNYTGTMLQHGKARSRCN